MSNPFLFTSSLGNIGGGGGRGDSDDEDNLYQSSSSFSSSNINRGGGGMSNGISSGSSSLFDTTSYQNPSLWSTSNNNNNNQTNNNNLFNSTSTSFNINNLPEEDGDDDNNNFRSQQQSQHRYDHLEHDQDQGMMEDEDNDIIDELSEFQNKNAKSDDHQYYDIIEKELNNNNIGENDLPLQLAQLFRSYCESKLNSLQYQIEKSFYLPNKNETERLIEIFKMEKNTWEILFKLYHQRDRSSMETDKLENLDITSQVNTIQYNIHKDSQMSENIIILDWLEEMVSNVKLNVDNVYWKNTLERLKGGHVRTHSSPKESELVKEVDPDAVQRQTLKLDHEDQQQENKFLQTLWQLIRAGNRELAAEFCREVGQMWRAQTLLGDRLYDSESDIGNPYRNMWRTTCNGMSASTANQFEKAIYGLLGGNLPSVLPVCRNWYDYLWAHVKVLVDEKMNQEIQGLAAPPTAYEDFPPPKPTISTIFTPKDILHTLRTNAPTEIKTESNQPYNLIQEMIITDDYITLVKSLLNIINSKQITPEFNRLAVVIVLFFRFRSPNIPTSIDENSPENVIINTYVEYLIENQKNDLVALYTSFLTCKKLQIKVYSKFLEGITSQSERQQCLDLAERFGLDTDTITYTVVSNITSQESTSKSLSTTTQDDINKIDALGYLVISPSQLIGAIAQANKLLREFIKNNKIDAAHQLIGSLPEDSVIKARLESTRSEAETTDIIKEFTNWAQYLAAINKIAIWFQNFSKRPTQPTLYYRLTGKESYAQKLDLERRKKDIEEEYARWSQNNLNYGHNAIDSIDIIIKQSWLCPEDYPDGVFAGGEEQELKQLHALRVSCIPPLFFTLHKILVGIEQIKKSVRIVNIVAEERFKWYNVFSRAQLQELLQLTVKDSIYKMMEKTNKNDKQDNGQNFYQQFDYLQYSNYYYLNK
ncbi:nucleoporin [Cavenderia fasciculata]|uniref:Nuclear pore complex protein n=1 Tax=Cavenderia fasciculata TaxID=261658 RepID=F4PQT9_CACFS|nr:nucleoporin [Cavenderia fasciculata]EGG22047.1 nucleoporin [Cavenderia fasciculata]|eukprot:XP_004359898.1 nucleoporin [Cavenderia fasciculata]